MGLLAPGVRTLLRSVKESGQEPAEILRALEDAMEAKRKLEEEPR